MRSGSGIVLAIVATGIAGAACAGEVAREWLDRVNVALDELTYIGTFVRLTNGDHETMHVAHRYVDGALNERIVSLDGVGREILRLDDDVLVILPDQEVVMYEKVIASNPMVAALPDYSRKLEVNYELWEFGTEKVAGREAQIISIRPRGVVRWLRPTLA